MYQKLDAARQADYMMRFDCCAVEEVKYRLGQGEPEWREKFLDLPIDDMRAYSMIFDYPREVLPVWKRPWIATRIVDAYPVEFRVFVQDGEVAGVSSYYPQRNRCRRTMSTKRGQLLLPTWHTAWRTRLRTG